jgi:hypothetical protein
MGLLNESRYLNKLSVPSACDFLLLTEYQHHHFSNGRFYTLQTDMDSPQELERREGIAAILRNQDNKVLVGKRTGSHGAGNLFHATHSY